MPDIVFVVIRLALLVLLWFFVLAAIRVIRTDLMVTANRSAVRPAKAPVTTGGPVKRKNRRSAARKLVVTQGGLAGTTITLGDGAVTLGRADDSTLVLTDDYASTHHARLTPAEDAWVLEDLGSTNGTYLDRSRVSRPVPVPLGTPIRIGKTVLELRR